jgi:CAAX protease family protein
VWPFLSLKWYIIFLNGQQELFDQKHLFFALKMLGLLAVIMLPLALAAHYVRIDPKIPSGAFLWALNNLFFVSFAEEAIFRGFIQGGMSRVVVRSSYGRWLPLVLGSLTFGLAHYQGGLAYMCLATVAGLFYGYTYQITRSLEAAMLVHFCLNLIHFLFFSYPSLKAGLI